MANIERSVPASSFRPASLRRAGRWIALALLIVVSMGAGVMIGASVDRAGGANASSRLSTMPEFQVLEETYDAIREYSVLSDDVTDQELMYGASRGMVDALGDEGHSRFLTPEEAQNFQLELESELIGIGVHIDLRGPLPVIIAPIDGSPAYRAGIQPGDVIVAVDGVESARRTPTEVTDLISGEAGTDVTLVLRHQNESETYEVTITRAQITLDMVSYRMLPNNVLWLRVSQFAAGASEDVREALAWGKEHGMTGVVLDLRNNPGGYTIEALGVGTQFLPAGSVLYQEEAADGTVVERTIPDDTGEWTAGELIVMINGGSASAAEIVASAIQDNGRGELYGETTVGTGTVLSGFTLSDGSMALIGTKMWLTAAGDEVWKEGVEPTVEVSLADDGFPALPFQFETGPISSEMLRGIEDAQLHAAYGALVPTAMLATPAA